MIRIIDGTRYNTETAEWVGDYRSKDECGNAHYVTDFGFYFADLHRTKTGAWCLETPEGIQPITEDEAFDWLQETTSSGKDHVAALEKYFADRIVNA